MKRVKKMLECGRWKKCFLISLGVHSLVLLFAAYLWSQNQLEVKTAKVEMQVQLIGSAAESGGGSGNEESADADLPEEEEAFEEETVTAMQSDTMTPLESKPERNRQNKKTTEQRREKKAHAQGATTQGNKQGNPASGTSASGQGAGNGQNAFGSGNFLNNGDGSYTALNSDGIAYAILRDAQAQYPEEARALGYGKVVCVQSKILVGLDGHVEQVEVLNQVPNLGFREAAVKALRNMQFAPIYYQGHNIKMYFVKKIYFQA